MQERDNGTKMSHYSDDYETADQKEYRRKRQRLEERMERILIAAIMAGIDKEDDKDLEVAKDMAECLVGLIMKDSGTKYKMTSDL